MKQQIKISPATWVMKRFRRIRRGTIILLAAMPVLQGLGACDTGVSQVLGGVVNQLPSLSYNAVQSIILIPFEIGLALLTGRDLSNIGNGGSSGIGGSGGFGGSSITGSSGI